MVAAPVPCSLPKGSTCPLYSCCDVLTWCRHSLGRGLGFECHGCYLGSRSQCGSHSALDHLRRKRSHNLGHRQTCCKTGVRGCMLKSISKLGAELGRLAVMLRRKESTSEHLLSKQIRSCTKDAAENRSAWKRTKSELSQGSAGCMQDLLSYIQSFASGLWGFARRCLVRSMYG